MTDSYIRGLDKFCLHQRFSNSEARPSRGRDEILEGAHMPQGTGIYIQVLKIMVLFILREGAKTFLFP